MMRREQLVLTLSILPLVIIGLAAGGYVYLSHTIHPTAKALSTLSAPKANDSSPQPTATSGKYTYDESSKSKINKSEKGRLAVITRKGDSHSFLQAFPDSQNVSALKTSPDWTAQEVGHDPMWIPGACAQKPSWIIPGGFVVIDDADYNGINAYHYYALYDTNRKIFRSFGGTLANVQQQREKVIYVNVEAGKLVFYIDQQDPSGPYSGSSSFKHSKADHEASIIRRVIEVPQLAYTDSRIPFELPAFDGYHVDVNPAGSGVQLVITADGKLKQLAGAINGITPVKLAAISNNDLAASSYQNTNVELDRIKKQLNIPEYSANTPIVPYLDNYSLRNGNEYFSYNGAPALFQGTAYSAAYTDVFTYIGAAFIMGQF